VDRIHDLGGMGGFGPVEVERDEPTFHERWEALVFALNSLGIVVLKAYNADEYRHAVERMDPAHYLAASYYERVLTGVASLLVEKGTVTRTELEVRAGGAFPLARPASVPRPDDVAPHKAHFAVGAPVRVRDVHPRGHTRVPRYVRGKRGVIVHVAPKFSFPDTSAHGLAHREEHTYQVRFEASELWGSDAGSDEAVIVDLWASYLEPLP